MSAPSSAAITTTAPTSVPPPGVTSQPVPAQDAEPLALLADLRAQRAQRMDAARFATLEAMARRIPAQAAPVAALLRERLLSGARDYQRRWIESHHSTESGTRREAQGTAARCEPLAQLNAHIRAVSPSEAAGPGELAAARRFRAAWSLARAQDQVGLAVARRPANAGPLNSHALVLESLGLMQALSPEYLRRFLAQVESLQWLEQARAHYPTLQGKRRPGPGKKTGAKPRARSA